jgi:hypothetical protein
MPGVRLHLVEGASAQLEEQLREGRLEMALVLRVSPDDIGETHILAHVALHLVGRHGDDTVTQLDEPLTSLSGLPLVVPSRPHLLRARLDRLANEHGLRLTVVTEADSVQLQREATTRSCLSPASWANGSRPHPSCNRRLKALSYLPCRPASPTHA